MGSRWPDGSPGPEWDADIWVAPCNQEETHVSGVPPKARSGTLASRLSPYNQEKTQVSFGVLRGGSWGAVGGGFPITFCMV